MRNYSDEELRKLIREQITRFVNSELPGSGYWDGEEIPLTEDDFQQVYTYCRNMKVLDIDWKTK